MIQYPAFRAWQAMHKRSNNSIVALIIGANLARRELGKTRGLRAGEALMGVARSENLDVTAADAQQIFETAALDMAFLAIPQIVALHIELCVGTVVECQRFPGLIKPHDKAPNWWLVPELTKALRFGSAGTAPTNAGSLMKFCVKLRNCIMHGAGRVDEELERVWRNLPPAAKQRWESLAGRPFTYARTDALPELDWGEVKATLAVTKESAHELNGRVQNTLTRAQWAQVIAHDYRDSSLRSRRRFNTTAAGKLATDGAPLPDRTLGRLQGHAMTYYRPLEMTLEELQDGRQAIR